MDLNKCNIVYGVKWLERLKGSKWDAISNAGVHNYLYDYLHRRWRLRE